MSSERIMKNCEGLQRERRGKSRHSYAFAPAIVGKGRGHIEKEGVLPAVSWEGTTGSTK